MGGQGHREGRERMDGWVCDRRAGIMGEKVVEGRGREGKGRRRGKREEVR